MSTSIGKNGCVTRQKHLFVLLQYPSSINRLVYLSSAAADQHIYSKSAQQSDFKRGKRFFERDTFCEKYLAYRFVRYYTPQGIDYDTDCKTCLYIMSALCVCVGCYVWYVYCEHVYMRLCMCASFYHSRDIFLLPCHQCLQMFILYYHHGDKHSM